MPVSAPSPRALGSVTAVVFTDSDEAGALGILDALTPLSAELARVVVRMGGRGAGEVSWQTVYADHPLHATHGVQIVGVSGDVGAALGQARLLTLDPPGWLWLLEAASVPEADALSTMLSVAARSRRVGIVGPKLVSHVDPRVVFGVGQSISMWGRSLDDLNPVGWDQGQHDDRSDVVGVPLAGMLIRTDVLADVGGLQGSMDQVVAGLDLCWRAHLLGHRVLVAPYARVRHGSRLLDSTERVRADTTSVRVARQRAWVALARGAITRVPGRAIAMLTTSLFAMVLMLATRRPRAFALAWAEASAVLYPWPALGARWRFRGASTVSERDLKELFLSRAETRMSRRWAPVLADPLTPVPTDNLGERQQHNVAALETGPVSDEALSMESDAPRPRRLWSAPLAVAVLVAVLATGWRWRDLGPGLAFSGWGVTAPEMVPVGADAAAMFSAWWQGWTGEGLGQAGQGASWLLPLSGVAAVFEYAPGGPDAAHVAGVTTAWLLFASMPLSVLTAYAAARSLVWSRPIRAVLALGWASASPLVAGVDTGRVGPAVVHMAAPLIVAGVLGSLRPGRRGTSAAFGVAALVSFVTWWVPFVGVVAVLAALVVAVAARGWARLRGVAIAVLPLALLGPSVLPMVADPVRLIGGAGATSAGAPPVAAWQALLLHPGGPESLSMWWVAPVWLLALAGVLGVRRGQSTGIATWLLIAGLLGVAGAVALSRTSVGQLPLGYAEAGLSVTVWPGTLLSVAGACVLLAAGIGATDLLPRAGASRGLATRSMANAASAIVLALAGAGVLGTLALNAANGVGPTIAAAKTPRPAVVADQVAEPDRVRVITLIPDPVESEDTGAFGVRYNLGGVEPANWLRDRTVELALTDSRSEVDPVSAAVTALLDTSDATVLDPAPIERALSELAVAYIVVDAPQSHPLVTQLDQLPNLTRVSSARSSALWRIEGVAEASRVWTQSEDGQRQAMSLRGSGAATTGTVPPEATQVVVSELPAWAETAAVTLDGDLLSSEPGFPLRYAVAPGGGSLVIEVPPAWPQWWWATAALFALVLLLAIPFVGSRPRRMT